MLAVFAICLLLGLAGCGGPGAHRSSRFTARAEDGHPSFLTRVHDDCVEGQRWACDMLESLQHALQEREDR